MLCNIYNQNKLQIHDVEFAETLDPVINEALPTLEALVKEGKVRFIGVTGYPLNVLKEAILRAPGRFDVSSFFLNIFF